MCSSLSGYNHLLLILTHSHWAASASSSSSARLLWRIQLGQTLLHCCAASHVLWEGSAVLTCPGGPLGLPSAPPRMGMPWLVCQLVVQEVRCLPDVACTSPPPQAQPLLAVLRAPLRGAPCREDQVTATATFECRAELRTVASCCEAEEYQSVGSICIAGSGMPYDPPEQIERTCLACYKHCRGGTPILTGCDRSNRPACADHVAPHEGTSVGHLWGRRVVQSVIRRHGHGSLPAACISLAPIRAVGSAP